MHVESASLAQRRVTCIALVTLRALDLWRETHAESRAFFALDARLPV
jgi:hypothetical protein